jgi:diguanylate cyclase (GGDEF)-like protein
MSEKNKFRVVVADDDPNTLALLVRLLERAGYSVYPCRDGREAAKTLSELGSGIMIADWRMPEMDGLELCRWIREMQALETLQHVYFIMLTVKEDKGDLIAALTEGANDYLTKPYHEGELLARMRVGERMLQMQDELVQRSLDLQKANSAMALLAARLETAANTDSLTGLVNRRRIMQHVEEYLSCREGPGHIAFLMIDVDHFKQVNDTYGHAAGDRVLAGVAGAISSNTRRPELCGRFGGEEFLVLLPRAPEALSVQVAEQIRREVAARVFPAGPDRLSVTVSIGVARDYAPDATADELLRAADQMLYLAKHRGRDQVWVLGADGLAYPALHPEQREQPVLATESSSSIRVRSRNPAVECGHAHSADQR